MCIRDRCNDWHFAETEINSFSVVAVFEAPEPLPVLPDIDQACPFSCVGMEEGNFDYVNSRDNPCPCKLSACNKTGDLDSWTGDLDINKAPLSCLEGIKNYCSIAPGWFYEPENCWPFHANNISIELADGNHDTHQNTPVLGDRHVSISWTNVPDSLKILVTEVSDEELEANKDLSLIHISEPTRPD